MTDKREQENDREGSVASLFDKSKSRTPRPLFPRLSPILLLILIVGACMMLARFVGEQNARRLTFEQAVQTIFPSNERAPVDEFLAKCPTEAEMDAVDADVTLRFDSDPTAGSGQLACRATLGSRDLTPFQKRVYNAIRVIKEFEFDEPLPWTSKPLYDWFADAADTVKFREEISLSFCCEPTGVINIRTHGLAINETERFLDPALEDGIASFILLLLHETRHAEGYIHTCGTNADLRLTEMGAWGLQYSLDVWMADHTDAKYFSAPDTDYRRFFLEDAKDIVQAYICVQPTPVP
jgi:hypothetical protein